MALGGEVTATSAVMLATNPGGSLTVTPGALTYDATMWNTAQGVTVQAGHAADGVNETLTVRHTMNAGTTTALTVTVKDNDAPPGVTVSAATLSVTEPVPADWTAVGTYTVVLDAGLQTTLSGLGQDRATVGFEADAGAGSAVRLTSARRATPGRTAGLTFTVATWNTAQTITVHAQADANGVNEAVTIAQRFDGWSVPSGYYSHANQLTAASCPSGSTCATTVAVADVTVNVADRDTPALVVDTEPTTPATAEATPLRVAETEAEPYTVALATESSAAVEVTVTSGNTAAVTVAPATLTFSATNWNTAQTVTASAVDDMNQDGETVTLTHTLAGAAEYVPPALAVADVATVTVQVTDDDAPGLALSEPTLTVEENGAAVPYTMVPVPVGMTRRPVAADARPAVYAVVAASKAGDSVRFETVAMGTHLADTDRASTGPPIPRP